MNADTLSEATSVADRAPRGGRAIRWVVPVGVAAVVAAVAAGAAVLSHRTPTSPARPAASGRFLDWPARGADKDDAALVQEATDHWDGVFNNPTRTRMRPHTDVRVLFAQRYEFGYVAVLEGVNQSGTAFVAVVAAGRTAGGDPIGTVDASELPEDPATVTQVSGTIGIERSMQVTELHAFVLGDPGTTSVSYRPVAAADYVVLGADYGETTVPRGGVRGIRTYHGDRVAYDGPFDERILSLPLWVPAAPVG